MGEPNDDIWTLVAKQVTGELTEEEARRLAEWQQQRPENHTTVEQAKEMWQRSKETEITYEPDVEEGWQRFLFRREQNGLDESQLDGSEPGVRRLTSGTPDSKSRKLVWWSGVAATLALLITIGFLWRNTASETEWEQFATTEGEKLLLTLPDSSQVWLNGSSTLRYATNFNVDNRTVYLEGEAFFDVKKAEGRRFTIFSGPAKTEVIGTSFNLRAYAGQPVAVQVVSGRVAFSPANRDDAVFLEPGEEAVLTETAEPAQKQEISDANFRAWQNNVLNFENISLAQIARQMEEQYGISIELADAALANCRYTAMFEDASLDDVLTTLSIIGDLSYQQQGNHYILSGPGCQ
jgi:ferric-dicitrate binding protein FerR (iron transport regulator)